MVLRGLEHRGCAGERRARVPERGGRVHGAAVLAGVAVLVLRAAVWALALDVAVGKEHALQRVEELLDALGVDQAAALQLAVDVLRELDVLRGIRRMPVVEGDMEALQIARALAADPLHELARADSLGLGFQHDRRAVRVIGAHEMDRMPLHALEAHPDIGLDVLHDVADMKRAVGVGQRRGDEEGARHPGTGETVDFSLHFNHVPQ
jgi:hypothetical protein